MFESLQEKFHKTLPEELSLPLEEYTKTLSVEKLSHLLEALHEFMLLHVAKEENTNDEDYYETVENKYFNIIYSYGLKHINLA